MNLKSEEKFIKNNKKLHFFVIFIVFFMIFSSFLLISCGQKSVAIEEIHLSYNQVAIYKGQTQKIRVEVLPEKANVYSITWTSSAPKTVSVDKLGYIRGLQYGTATITASVKNSDVKAECKVVVNDGKICNLKANADFKIYYEGQSFDQSTLKVYGVYESGRKITLDPNTYSVEIPNPLAIDSEIKITYGNLNSIYYSPYVLEDYVSQLEIASAPTKNEYVIGEAFDKSGMVVNLVYASGKREATENYTIDTTIVKFKQTEVKISYDEEIFITTPITTRAQIIVDSISKLQTAINEGYSSIMLADGSYNTTSQITLNSTQNILIFGQTSTTSINGYNIIPLKIIGNCGTITLADLCLTTIGETPQTHQIDLSLCESGEINLKNITYTSILHAQTQKYLLKED